MTPDARQSGTYELPRGSAVGKYEILRRLAVGGMAEIYLARSTGQAGFEKLVVLKRILPNVAEDPTFVQMFLEEARLAATLRHANIADVYDVGEDNGTYFFTMEYVYGQDARVMRHETNKRREPIPLPIALTIIHGAASALEHAHELKGSNGKPVGLVHRDVSASNVMISYDGAVKLLDFGIARASSSQHKTQTGTLKGKIPYMSPEQCKGQPLDRRSDLFSLGVVLYELTVGRRPFRGDSDFAIMDQIVYKGAVPPSQMVTGYPPELEAIVMKLLARDMNERYASASDMLVDLDEFVGKHGLWMSPRAVGKYMRTLFAAQIKAWEAAEQEGVPFAQHVVQSVTSQSQRSELVTPPSSFNRPIAPGTPSQEMRAQRPPDAPAHPIATMAPLPVVRREMDAPTRLMPPPAVAPPPQHQFDPAPSAPSAPSHTYQSATVYPSLRPRSSRVVVIAFVGAIVLGAGGFIAYLASNSDAPVAATVEPETKQSMPMTETKPAVVETKPAIETPPVETKPVETKPVEAQTKPVVETKPVEAKPVETKPVQTKPVVETEPETKPVATKPKPPIVKPKPTPKDKETPAWDPNSPFLPQ